MYRESFERLRVLKPEIEHVRKVRVICDVLCSACMCMAQYPLSVMLGCMQILEKGRTTLQNQFDTWYNALHARDGMVLSGSSNGGGKSASNLPRGQPQASRRAGDDDHRWRADSKQSWSDEPSPSAKPTDDDRPMLSSRRSEQSKKHMADLNDSDGDGEDVNEDILAFHRAKEELLKRRSSEYT